MAKTNIEDKGKVKFRFVEFELEGLNSTIEESIKNIVHSMNRGSGTVQRVLPPKSTNPLVLPSNGNTGDAAYSEEEPTDSEINESADEPKLNAATSSGSKLRRYTQPTFLNNLDLDSGPLPFKTFAEKQNPKSDNRKYLVIAAWLKKNRNLEVISTDHVYTCNQKMGWRTQKDVGQPFRYMKKKSYFDPAGRNQWNLTHIGLDQLNSPEEE
jgi:hypothetical protein